MSVETMPNKLVKGLVLDTFHTDVDNTVATYALNAQLEDQEGNHFHYGSEVGTTYIKEIPTGHVVVGHINMERNETVLFTTDGTNSTIGILSRNDNMSYHYEIKVDDTKQAKKLNFKKEGYVRGVYRLLNGCDKVIYFVDGVNKDRRININQLDSYKIADTQSVASGIIFDDSLRATIFALSSASGNIQLIRLMSASPEATANVLATLTVGVDTTKLLDVSVNAFATVLATLTRTANIISSEEAKGTTTVNVDVIRLLQTNVSALASVNATLESIQQGVVEIDVTLSGEALSTVTLLRSALLEVTLTTEATTVAEAILTKVINAQVEALADTSSSAQISIPINVTADATSTTDADVILSSAINVSADATAETTAIVQLSKVISASVDALADSSSEALIGLVLVSTSTASASISTVDLVIGNSLVASVTAEGTTTAELLIAELLETSVNAQANITTANSLVSKLLASTVNSLATPTNTLTVADVLTSSASSTAVVTTATLESNPSIDADATAFFLRVTTAGGTLTTTEQSAVNTLVKALKANGTWAKMLAIYPMVGGGQANPAAACAQNLKSSSFTATFAGCSFASTGVTPNGTNGFMDTGIIPSIHLQQNSIHGSSYCLTDAIQNGPLFSSEGTSYVNGLYVWPRFGSNGSSVRINDSTSTVTSILDSLGFHLINRISSTSKKYLKNNTVIFDTSIETTGIHNASIYAGSSRTAINNYTSFEQSFLSFGTGLTDTEASNFYTAVQAFQTSLNRSVGTPIVSDADAQAFINRVYTDSGTLTNQEANAVNQLVIDMKANGTWTKMKAIYPMVGASAAACKQNLKSASYIGTFTGASFASTGVTFNGTSGYMDTNFNTSTQISTALNLTFGGYQRIQQLREEILFGNSVGPSNPRIEMYARQSGGGYFLNIGGSFVNATNTDARGFYLGKSNSSGTIAEGYKNGSLFMSGASVPNLKNANMWLGGIFDYAAYSSNEFSFAFIGDGQLSAGDVTNFYNIVQTFQTTLNRQINP
jgi:hypothetical protein